MATSQEAESRFDIENPVRHPLSNFFGDVPDTDLETLKESILDVGVQNPIIIDEEGQVVDGFQRCRAIQELTDEGAEGIEFEIEVTDNPGQIVWALNVARRHMPAQQRAEKALLVDEWCVNNIEGYEPKTRKQLAEQAEVSERTITRARNPKDEDEDVAPKGKSKIEELEEELMAVRGERDQARAELADRDERIALMTESAKSPKEQKDLKAFIALQKRLKAALTKNDTQQARITTLQNENRTLKAQLKKR